MAAATSPRGLTRFFTAVTATLVLVVTACGGGDDASDTGADTSTATSVVSKGVAATSTAAPTTAASTTTRAPSVPTCAATVVADNTSSFSRCIATGTLAVRVPKEPGVQYEVDLVDWSMCTESGSFKVKVDTRNVTVGACAGTPSEGVTKRGQTTNIVIPAGRSITFWGD